MIGSLEFKDLVKIQQHGDDTEYVYQGTAYYASEIVGVFIDELGINSENVKL